MKKERCSVRLEPRQVHAINRIFGGLGVFLRAAYRVSENIPYIKQKIKEEIERELNKKSA